MEKEHSFEVLILLNYSRLYSVCPETAFTDIFNISLEDTYCSICVPSKFKDGDYDYEENNIGYLRKIAHEV